MEHFALIVLQWLGRAITQKLAGSALQAIWHRFSPYFEQLLSSANSARETAGEFTDITENRA